MEKATCQGSSLLRVFDDYLFRLELFIIGLDEGVQLSGLSLLYRNDHIGLVGETGMIEIIPGRLGWVIRVRVIIADDLKTVFVCVSVGAFVLVGCDPVAIRMRLALRRGCVMMIGSGHGFAERFGLTDRSVPFVISRVNFAQNIDAVLKDTKQKSAALVRVSLLAMLIYLFDMLLIQLDCQLKFPLRS